MIKTLAGYREMVRLWKGQWAASRAGVDEGWLECINGLTDELADEYGAVVAQAIRVAARDEAA